MRLRPERLWARLGSTCGQRTPLIALELRKRGLARGRPRGVSQPLDRLGALGNARWARIEARALGGALRRKDPSANPRPGGIHDPGVSPDRWIHVGRHRRLEAFGLGVNGFWSVQPKRSRGRANRSMEAGLQEAAITRPRFRGTLTRRFGARRGARTARPFHALNRWIGARGGARLRSSSAFASPGTARTERCGREQVRGAPAHLLHPVERRPTGPGRRLRWGRRHLLAEDRVGPASQHARQRAHPGTHGLPPHR